jgi:hypothetical protein
LCFIWTELFAHVIHIVVNQHTKLTLLPRVELYLVTFKKTQYSRSKLIFVFRSRRTRRRPILLTGTWVCLSSGTPKHSIRCRSVYARLNCNLRIGPGPGWCLRLGWLWSGQDPSCFSFVLGPEPKLALLDLVTFIDWQCSDLVVLKSKIAFFETHTRLAFIWSTPGCKICRYFSTRAIPLPVAILSTIELAKPVCSRCWDVHTGWRVGWQRQLEY